MSTMTLNAQASSQQSTGEVTKLLTQLNRSTETLLKYFSSKGLPEPSYVAGDGLDPSVSLPQDVQSARDAALEASDELHYLLLGPLNLVLGAPGDVRGLITSLLL